MSYLAMDWFAASGNVGRVGVVSSCVRRAESGGEEREEREERERGAKSET